MHLRLNKAIDSFENQSLLALLSLPATKNMQPLQTFYAYEELAADEIRLLRLRPG